MKKWSCSPLQQLQVCDRAKVCQRCLLTLHIWANRSHLSRTFLLMPSKTRLRLVQERPLEISTSSYKKRLSPSIYRELLRSGKVVYQRLKIINQKHSHQHEWLLKGEILERTSYPFSVLRMATEILPVHPKNIRRVWASFQVAMSSIALIAPTTT